MVARLLELRELTPTRAPALVAMIGCTGLKTVSLPVERARRPVGSSAYSTARRARSGLQVLAWAIAWKLRGRRRRTGATRAEIERHNASQRRYFERAPKPTMIPNGDTRYLNRHVDETLAAAGIQAGERVLEIGCGLGRYTLLFADRGIRVEGLDLSRVQLDQLAEFDAGRHDIPLHQADVLDPPAELLGQFDAAVVGMFTLHHIHDIAASLRSTVRLLRAREGGSSFASRTPSTRCTTSRLRSRPGMTWRRRRHRQHPPPAARPRARRRRARGLYWKRFGFFPPFLANSPLGSLERPLESFPLWRGALPFQLFGGKLRVLVSSCRAELARAGRLRASVPPTVGA